MQQTVIQTVSVLRNVESVCIKFLSESVGVLFILSLRAVDELRKRIEPEQENRSAGEKVTVYCHDSCTESLFMQKSLIGYDNRLRRESANYGFDYRKKSEQSVALGDWALD